MGYAFTFPVQPGCFLGIALPPVRDVNNIRDVNARLLKEMVI
jgi:hypothetical protein